MNWLQWMTSAVVAAALAALAIRLLMPVSARWGLVDVPRGRKQHARVVAVTGGIAMLVAILVGMWALPGPISREGVGLAMAAIMLVGVGVLDDKYDLPWYLRITLQMLAALLMIHVGDIRIDDLGTMFGVRIDSLGMWSIPFTVFATVGAINAVNMVDGADGLAGLLVLGCLLMLAAAAAHSGNVDLLTRAPILIGALLGFLYYNMRLPWRPHAVIFMGNSGSALLGLVVAWAVCLLTQNPLHPVDPVLAIWLVPVPIIDCLTLMLRRVRQRRSPFSADREHVHHLLHEAGFGPTRAAALLVIFSLACGLSVALLLRAGVPHLVLFLAFVVLGVAWYAFTARRARAVGVLRALRLQRTARSVVAENPGSE